MEAVSLFYKTTNGSTSMNIVAGFKNKEGKLFLIREKLNNTFYLIEDETSLNLVYGIEASMKLVKKVLETECGEDFKFKGKKFQKLKRVELINFLNDKTFNPLKVSS